MQRRRDLPERTFEFARRVVHRCQVLDQTPGVSRTLANQLLRAATSIGANDEANQLAAILTKIVKASRAGAAKRDVQPDR